MRLVTSTRVAMPAAARPRAAAGASTTAGAPLRFSSGCSGTGAIAAGAAVRSDARKSSSTGRGRARAAVAPGDGPAPLAPALGEAGDTAAGATAGAASASPSSSSSSCSSKPKLSATSFSKACESASKCQGACARQRQAMSKPAQVKRTHRAVCSALRVCERHDACSGNRGLGQRCGRPHRRPGCSGGRQRHRCCARCVGVGGSLARVRRVGVRYDAREKRGARPQPVCVGPRRRRRSCCGCFCFFAGKRGVRCDCFCGKRAAALLHCSSTRSRLRCACHRAGRRPARRRVGRGCCFRCGPGLCRTGSRSGAGCQRGTSPLAHMRCG